MKDGYFLDSSVQQGSSWGEAIPNTGSADNSPVKPDDLVRGGGQVTRPVAVAADDWVEDDWIPTGYIPPPPSALAT